MHTKALIALIALVSGMANASPVTITFDNIGLVGYDEPNFYQEGIYKFKIVPELSVSHHLDGRHPVALHTSSTEGGFRIESDGRLFSLLSVDYSITALSGAYIVSDDGRQFLMEHTESDSLVNLEINIFNVRWAEFHIPGGGYLNLDNLTAQSIPEPSTIALAILALGFPLAVKRQRS